MALWAASPSPFLMDVLLTCPWNSLYQRHLFRLFSEDKLTERRHKTTHIVNTQPYMMQEYEMFVQNIKLINKTKQIIKTLTCLQLYLW